jgi:hypothetical protein
MIDEQDIFFARIKRWEELSSPGVHALGIVDWIGPLEAIAKPVDFKTKSLLEVVACYMEATGNEGHAHLLRKSFSRLLHDCRKLASEELKSKNMEELSVIYRERGPLWHSRQSNMSLCHAIGDMVISFHDDSFEWKESFDRTVSYLEEVNPSGDVKLPTRFPVEPSGEKIVPVEDWHEHDIKHLRKVFQLPKRDRNTLPRWADNPSHPYLKTTDTRGRYLLDHNHPFIKGKKLT